jgi:hypothetical protein
MVTLRSNQSTLEAKIACDPHYVPSDVAIAKHVFGANCGPISAAAAISEDVCDIMKWFPQFDEPDRRFTNLTSMKRALSCMEIEHRVLRREFPRHGVALIQWLGPWTSKDFFSRWSLQHSHWIAVSGRFVFDYIDETWRTLADWEHYVAPHYIDQLPQAAGWEIKFGVEIGRSNSPW